MQDYKITISHIADSLGISSMSVSRALSGQSGVSNELRNKVIKKAKEIGYIKTKKNSNINILVLHEKPFFHDSSTFSLRVQGIEKALQEAGVEYSIEFVDKENQDKMYLPYKLSRGTHYDGVILLGKFNHRYASFINDKIKNLVFYTGYSPSYDYDSVWFNFNNSGYKQCQYLIKNGHKNISYLGNKSIFRNKEMMLGIITALEDYKIAVKNEFFIDMNDNYKQEIIGLINREDRPTAIICELDFTALELIKLLYDNNIRVPQDISIIGTGNTQMSTLSIPALTTMDLNIEYSCESAVALLLKQINYPDKPKENIAIYCTLVERDSVKNIFEQ